LLPDHPILLERMFEDELNPEQGAAATHGDGPLLIVAGAGTGKTTTLAARVAWLVAERDVRPERILLLTFSRRAAREMVTRAERMTGRADAGRVFGGTFHAVANRLLRIHGRALGLSPSFTILDQADGADVMNLLREELGFASRGRRFPRKDTLAAVHSRVVNAGEKLDEVVRRWYPWCADDVDGMRAIFHAYIDRKRAQQTLDYDDLLLFWKALATAPETGPRLASTFDHILVDEYQDTNALQADILDAMRPSATPRNLTVVGDDAQSIYGFRAATVRNILEVPTRFPGTTTVTLERNYRSTTPILQLSNTVIAYAAERHAKSLWTERVGGERPVLRSCLDDAEEADAVCRSVLEHRERGIAMKEQAVLFRAAHHSDRLEIELVRRNIPFVKYGGLKFLEAAHVKDALSLLRVLENPMDEVAWFRVLQLPEGMGPSTARKLMDELGVTRNQAGPAPLVTFLDRPVPVPKGAGDGIRALRSALEGCRDETLMRPAAQMERLRAYLEPVIARKYDAPGPRASDLEQLALLARGYESRGRFVAELTLDPPASTADLAGPPHLDDDYLILSTIHSAKGLEWDVVHVIHASDGNIPSDMALGDDEELEEERRLLYVALTRARDVVTLSFPQRYYRRQKPRDDVHMYGVMSRFLEPDDVRACLDDIGPAIEVRDDETVGVTGSASVDAYLADLLG
jgi:DNA helicase-2/ATP-dependent DNA helicase PcrA